MRVHVLQHVPFEGLGNIEPWLLQRGAQITYTRFYESAELPPLAGLDLVVAMGGPMSVNDEAELPWLVVEKRFVAAAIDAGVAVLGICLGSQLIASARGAKVYAGAEKEIGWFPVTAADATADTFDFAPGIEVLHWHGETFDLPPGAVRLASSAVCANQAFQLGARVIGLQFHMEMTQAAVQAIVAECADELIAGRYVQTAPVILGAPQERFAQTEQRMHEVLAYLLRD